MYIFKNRNQERQLYYVHCLGCDFCLVNLNKERWKGDIKGCVRQVKTIKMSLRQETVVGKLCGENLMGTKIHLYKFLLKLRPIFIVAQLFFFLYFNKNWTKALKVRQIFILYYESFFIYIHKQSIIFRKQVPFLSYFSLRDITLLFIFICLSSQVVHEKLMLYWNPLLTNVLLAPNINNKSKMKI